MGALSRFSAWRVGSYWEEMGGDTKIFLEKYQKRRAVFAEKLVGKGGLRFLFKDKPRISATTLPRRRRRRVHYRNCGWRTATEEVDVESVTEDLASEMSEDDPEERETGQKTWLVEKVTSLEKENGELKGALREMETRLALQENETCEWRSDL